MSLARINLFWLIIFTLTLPLAVLGSTHLARTSFEKVKLRGQTVTVKGYAEQPIVSDRAEWGGTIVVRDADRTTAYQTLEQQRGRFLSYLSDMGFPAEKVTLGPVSIRELYVKNEKGHTTNTIEGYRRASAVFDRVGGCARGRQGGAGGGVADRRGHRAGVGVAAVPVHEAGRDEAGDAGACDAERA